MKQLDLSVIVVTFNTCELTKNCIISISSSLATDPTLSYEIIVWDNASTDGTRDMLKNLSYSNVVPIFSEKNLGFGIANNNAVKKAQGSFILLLNSDTVALGDAIPKFYNWFVTSRFNLAGARLLNEDKSPQPSAARFYSLPVAFAALFLKSDSWGLSRYAPGYITEVDWVTGACILTTRKIYTELEGFDEKIFMYWEEVDLFYRARKFGYITGYFPQSQFIHLESASSNSRSAPILQIYQGYIYFYKKHFSNLHVAVIRYMLQLKAIISLVIGTITGNKYLKETYSKAYEIAKMG